MNTDLGRWIGFYYKRGGSVIINDKMYDIFSYYSITDYEYINDNLIILTFCGSTKKNILKRELKFPAYIVKDNYNCYYFIEEVTPRKFVKDNISYDVNLVFKIELQEEKVNKLKLLISI